MRDKRANGEGAIYFNESKNRFVGQYTTGYDENGKRKRKTVYGKTKLEVREKLKQIETQISTGKFVDKSEITIYHLAKQILDDEYNLNFIKEATYHRHIETLKRLKPIYNTPLQSTNEMQIKDFLLSHQNYSQSTLSKEFQLLKRTFDNAIKRGIVSKSPMRDMRMPKSRQKKQKVRALTIEEQSKLFNILLTEDIQYSQQMLISMLTGMRMGEINALDIRDINFNFNTISINKTISRGEKGEAILGNTTKTEAGARKIPLNDDVKTIFKDAIQERKTGLVFTHNDKMITTNQVNAQYNRVLKKYNIIDDTFITNKVTLHSLRHTYATRCIEAQMPPKVLQLLLGHTDITITMNTYCDAFENFQTESINKANSYLKSLGISMNGEEKTQGKNVS